MASSRCLLVSFLVVVGCTVMIGAPRPSETAPGQITTTTTTTTAPIAALLNCYPTWTVLLHYIFCPYYSLAKPYCCTLAMARGLFSLVTFESCMTFYCFIPPSPPTTTPPPSF